MCFVLCRAECTDLWNAYFDEHDIDFILTPSLWSDVTYYTEGVRGERPLNVKQEDGASTLLYSLLLYYRPSYSPIGCPC